MYVYVELVDIRHIIIREFSNSSIRARVLDFPNGNKAQTALASILKKYKAKKCKIVEEWPNVWKVTLAK